MLILSRDTACSNRGRRRPDLTRFVLVGRGVMTVESYDRGQVKFRFDGDELTVERMEAAGPEHDDLRMIFGSPTAGRCEEPRAEAGD